MGVLGCILYISDLFCTQVSKDSSSIKVIDFGLAELFETDQKAHSIFPICVARFPWLKSKILTSPAIFWYIINYFSFQTYLTVNIRKNITWITWSFFMSMNFSCPAAFWCIWRPEPQLHSCPDLATRWTRFFESSRNSAVYGTRGWNRSCAENFWVTTESRDSARLEKARFLSSSWNSSQTFGVPCAQGLLPMSRMLVLFIFLVWSSGDTVHTLCTFLQIRGTHNELRLEWFYTIFWQAALFADSQMNLLNPSRCARCQVTIPSWPLGPCRKGRKWNGRRPKDMDSTVDDLRFAPSTKPDFSFKREVLTRWQSELTRSIQEDWHTHLISFDHLQKKKRSYVSKVARRGPRTPVRPFTMNVWLSSWIYTFPMAIG